MADGSPSGRRGRGASFPLELPVSGDNVRLLDAGPTQPLKEVPKGTRALVVEDELALGEAVAALADEGFKVDRAANGEEALARLRERHYDVIICDLENAESGRDDVLQRSLGHDASGGAAAGVRDGRRRWHRSRAVFEESGCRWARSRSGCGISSGLREKRWGKALSSTAAHGGYGWSQNCPTPAIFVKKR